ncbi:LysE family translocator, partial [Francisella tularensis subsp. holarctica]|nr:LysE family translocator [Francisella tularensis subsp. holarctica]
LICSEYIEYISFSFYKSIFTIKQLKTKSNKHIKNIDNFEKPSNTNIFLNGAFTNIATANVLVFISSMLSIVDEIERC